MFLPHDITTKPRAMKVNIVVIDAFALVAEVFTCTAHEVGYFEITILIIFPCRDMFKWPIIWNARFNLMIHFLALLG
jgi:hypothetical protein